MVRRENIPTLPAFDCSVVGIYPHGLRLIGPSRECEVSIQTLGNWHSEYAVRMYREWTVYSSGSMCGALTNTHARRTNQTQEARVYSHDGPIKHREHGLAQPARLAQAGENIRTLPASDWSVVRIYLRVLRLIGRRRLATHSPHNSSVASAAQLSGRVDDRSFFPAVRKKNMF